MLALPGCCRDQLNVNQLTFWLVRRSAAFTGEISPEVTAMNEIAFFCGKWILSNKTMSLKLGKKRETVAKLTFLPQNALSKSSLRALRLTSTCWRVLPPRDEPAAILSAGKPGHKTKDIQPTSGFHPQHLRSCVRTYTFPIFCAKSDCKVLFDSHLC